jgi:cullin 1
VQLVLEVVQQLQRMFAPDVRLIKRRIDYLIEAEYLARDENNPNTFRYVA